MIKWLKLTKGYNSDKKRPSVTLVYDPLQIMGTITGRFHKNPLKTARGVAETRLTAEKLLKGYNSGKKTIEHDLDKICTSSGHGNNNWKVSSKSLENRRRSCGDKLVSTD